MKNTTAGKFKRLRMIITGTAIMAAIILPGCSRKAADIPETELTVEDMGTEISGEDAVSTEADEVNSVHSTTESSSTKKSEVNSVHSTTTSASVKETTTGTKQTESTTAETTTEAATKKAVVTGNETTTEASTEASTQASAAQPETTTEAATQAPETQPETTTEAPTQAPETQPETTTEAPTEAPGLPNCPYPLHSVIWLSDDEAMVLYDTDSRDYTSYDAYQALTAAGVGKKFDDEGYEIITADVYYGEYAEGVIGKVSYTRGAKKPELESCPYTLRVVYETETEYYMYGLTDDDYIENTWVNDYGCDPDDFRTESMGKYKEGYVYRYSIKKP